LLDIDFEALDLIGQIARVDEDSKACHAPAGQCIPTRERES
jgi:hypothetical protein